MFSVEVKWEGWTEGGLGLWLVVAAFLLGLREGGLAWNNILAGSVIVLAALIVPRRQAPVYDVHRNREPHTRGFDLAPEGADDARRERSIRRGTRSPRYRYSEGPEVRYPGRA